jgi:hypothetical protein
MTVVGFVLGVIVTTVRVLVSVAVTLVSKVEELGADVWFTLVDSGETVSDAGGAGGDVDSGVSGSRKELVVESSVA